MSTADARPPAPKRKAARARPGKRPPAPAVPPLSEQARRVNELATARGILPPRADGEPAGADGFDPAALADEMQLWRLNKAGGSYYLPDLAGVWREYNGNELKRELKARNVSAAKPEDGGQSAVERLLLYVQRHRNLDSEARALAGKKAGVHIIAQERLLVRRGLTLIEPAEGDCPTVRALVARLLGPDQAPYFYGWLKTAVKALRSGGVRNGQILYLVGPPGSGKSRLQRWIITALLGGRHADPSSYMLGRTNFNAELFCAEHLCIEDPDVSIEMKEREHFGKMCKRISVNDSHSFHPKGRDAMTLWPFWRVSVSQNDEPDDLAMIPPLDIFGDKIILIHCHRAEMPMPSNTDEERAAFERQVAAELPAFVHWLLNEWTIPAALACERFGVLPYVAPLVHDELNANSRPQLLLECIDEVIFNSDRLKLPEDWSATELEADLTSETSTRRRAAATLFKGAQGLGRLIKSLSKSHPHRVQILSRLPGKRRFALVKPDPEDRASDAA